MSDLVLADASRAAARRLAPELGQHIEADVETSLTTQPGVLAPEQFLDPVSLGGLIVSVATLAWTIYKDLRTKSSKPAREVLARRVRVKLGSVDESPAADRDRIVEVVVDEIITAAEANPNELDEG